MTMLKTLGSAIDQTSTTALAGVELNETPFFPGANATLQLSDPVAGAGVLSIQGSPDNTPANYTEITTMVAADGVQKEISPLPAWIRLKFNAAGTGTIAKAMLRGTQ